MGKKKKKISFKEYSKKALTAMMILWFIGAIFGFVVCTVQLIRVEPVSLYDLFAYIGAPVTGGIVSYMIKTAFENKEKIKNTTEEMDLP